MSDPVDAAWKALEREACIERGVQRERLAPAIDKHRPLIEAAIRSESAGTPRQEDFERVLAEGLDTAFVADLIEPLESGEVTLIARHLAIRCALEAARLSSSDTGGRG